MCSLAVIPLKFVLFHFVLDNPFFVFFSKNPCPNQKKTWNYPLKKWWKKFIFYEKNRWKCCYLWGKTCFFCQFSTKFQGQKWKFRLFTLFLTPNSNYKVQNLTQKMTKKNTFERNLTVKKWGGVDFTLGQIGRNWFRKKSTFF